MGCVPLQVGLLDSGSVWQQRASLWLRPVLPAQRRYDGRQLLLHLHGGGSWIHLQPVARQRAASPAPWETALLGMMMRMWRGKMRRVNVCHFHQQSIKIFFWGEGGWDSITKSKTDILVCMFYVERIVWMKIFFFFFSKKTFSLHGYYITPLPI